MYHELNEFIWWDFKENLLLFLGVLFFLYLTGLIQIFFIPTVLIFKKIAYYSDILEFIVNELNQKLNGKRLQHVSKYGISIISGGMSSFFMNSNSTNVADNILDEMLLDSIPIIKSIRAYHKYKNDIDVINLSEKIYRYKALSERVNSRIVIYAIIVFCSIILISMYSWIILEAKEHISMDYFDIYFSYNLGFLLMVIFPIIFIMVAILDSFLFIEWLKRELSYS